MTREDRLHEIDDQIAYLDAITTELKRRIMPGAPINVLGFSQGVATAARWSLRSSTPINRLVFWAGAIPPELDRDAMTAWRNTPVDLVLGDRDEYATPADLHASVRRLEAAGVNGREHLFAGTHRLEPVLLRRLLGG